VQQPIQGRPNERQLEALAMVQGWASKKRWETKMDAMKADRHMTQQQHWQTQMGINTAGRDKGKNKMWGEIDEDDDLGHEVIFYRQWKNKKHINLVSGIEKSLKLLRSVLYFMIFIIIWSFVDNIVDVDGAGPPDEGSLVIKLPQQKVRIVMNGLYFVMKFLFWEIPEKLLGQNTTYMDKMFRKNPVVMPVWTFIMKSADYLGPCKAHPVSMLQVLSFAQNPFPVASG
jgi:hypothetical protein